MESAKQTASTIKYFIDNPDKIVDVAKQLYADFDTMSPEEKADILGALASNLIPGAAVTKVTRLIMLWMGLIIFQSRIMAAVTMSH
ncbi:hypothetical protein D3P08_19090 [Paenibacillus nanensis]|uniref:Uncharacterized protein n=1 Tax=Paenibacillus nanensis TaxID=393251 RepID=A0A3A1URD9_9BACL|nr:hypothetical protein D3P08_19090 [Paenibacillus nanensis]